MRKGWIGVDLDGTLATYDKWRGPDHIGEPILPMIARINKWLAEGIEVRIMTARACAPQYNVHIEEWCLEHIGLVLPVTNEKDFRMLELWDDRAVRVIANSGLRCCE